MVLLLPVPPMIPTVSPDSTEKLISESAKFSELSDYLKLTPEKRMLPSATSVMGSAGSVIELFSLRTSDIRVADASEMETITMIMESIIRLISI